MTTIRWVIASVLMFLSVLLIVPTWFYMIRWWVKGVPMGFSYVPLIGGVLGACALFATPINGAWKLFWIPLVLDPLTPECVCLLVYKWKHSDSIEDET